MQVDALWMTEVGQIKAIPVVISDEPDVDEVQVEVKACGVCVGDIATWMGITHREGSQFPFQFGHEATGVVLKTGRKVKGITIGDKVIVAGNGRLMMQVINVHHSICAKIPNQVTDYHYWIGEPAVCVVSAVANCPINTGDTVALIGTGYMGLLNVQAYLSSLVGRLICFDIVDERLAIARKFGVTEAYNLNSVEAESIITELRNAGGADYVVECSASEAGLSLAYSLMRTGGTLNMFAWHRRNCVFNATQQHLGGWKVFNTSPFIDPHIEDRIKQTAKLMSRGLFHQRDLITHIMDYSQAQKMLEIASSKAEGYIKGVITF